MNVMPQNKETNSTATPATIKLGAELNFAAKEAYNLLRTNIVFSYPNSDGGKIIGVTSAAPSDGKTYTAINLAYSFAEAGYNVLVIDADMRKPTVAQKLDKPLSPGLSNLLVSNEKNVVHKSVMHENLNVITAGDIPPNPSELLGSEKMEAVLKLFVEHFDYIFLDLPPATVVADPLVVSKYLNGMVVVVAHKRTRQRDVIDTVRQLKMTGVRILGFVYNDYSEGGKSYKRYSHYKGYYSHDSESLPSKKQA